MCFPTRADYLASLPRRHSAAGALFFNNDGELLVLKPTYKDTWSIPGGVVDAGEMPRAAVVREVREELGLTVETCRLLAIDAMPLRPAENNPESYQFVFDGGFLSDAQIAAITLPADEIENHCFVDVVTALSMMGDSLRRRVDMAVSARRERVFYYLEHGQRVCPR